MTVSRFSPSTVRAVPPAKLLPPIHRKVPFVVDLKEGRDLARLLICLLAAGCALAAAGLWLLPGSAADGGAALIKSGLTAVLLVAGVTLVRAIQNKDRPEACFDPVRRELRIWIKAGEGRPHTVLRRSYDSIGAVRLGARSAALYEPDGTLLLRLPLADAKARQLLRAHLSGAVPIAS